MPVGAFPEIFSFASFVGGPVDFHFVTGIVYRIDATMAGDLQIDAIQTGNVPEPVTMLGLCLGLGGLTRYVRRRTRK